MEKNFHIRINARHLPIETIDCLNKVILGEVNAERNASPFTDCFIGSFEGFRAIGFSVSVEGFLGLDEPSDPIEELSEQEEGVNLKALGRLVHTICVKQMEMKEIMVARGLWDEFLNYCLISFIFTDSEDDFHLTGHEYYWN